MIGSLRGRLAELEPAGEQAVDCIVEVNGVGYRVTVGSRLAGSLGPIGTDVALAVHTHVREGAITLYGFANALERRTFEALLGAHGVGPALALAILSVHRPDVLAGLVASGDLDALCLVPGVGRKTAQRLVVDLGQRLEDLVPVVAGASGGLTGLGGARAEVAEALAALGYARDEVRGALERVSDELADDMEALLREALRDLAPRR